ncbi:toxin-antitoxin system YwqK family antitoxin [Jiulongibacter sp. NS-SX5]|uniref:toxin-antitoxin system YwqK family antitoxin n=1 Tax=Jiulongibacter sp. NS-SX5 TaxID=3463854 RepID=UPI004058D25F
MKSNLIITSLILCISILCNAQSAVPTAKTKAQRKAERKEMTLEERIEDALPVDVTLPSASINTPTDQITSVEDAKKYFNETVKDYGKKAKELKQKAKKTQKAVAEAKEKLFDGKQYKGIPVEKQIYRRGQGSRMQYIEFYTLEEFQQPSPYIRSLFWYDERTRRIVEAVMRDRKTNHLMHGPYKEYRGETLVKEGYYFMGAKDGRWETYDKDFILLDKVSYDEGFLEDAEITYYDEAQKKIDEVIPMLYGKKTGDYYKFHEGGTLAVEGQYDNGVKVGRWIEYYDTGNRRKRETQHPKDCYDETEPTVIREYNEQGKMTFEHDSVKRM